MPFFCNIYSKKGRTVFKETPATMAQKAPKLVDAGANIIGGCCGTGPDHIAAMRKCRPEGPIRS